MFGLFGKKRYNENCEVKSGRHFLLSIINKLFFWAIVLSSRRIILELWWLYGGLFVLVFIAGIVKPQNVIYFWYKKELSNKLYYWVFAIIINIVYFVMTFLFVYMVFYLVERF